MSWSAPRTAPSAGTPLVFGETLYDHFPDGTRVLGGAPFNVAWHMQALGLRPFVVTAVGDDETGAEAVARMERWGMETAGVQVDRRHPTGRVMATLVDGEPAFEIGTEQAYDYIDAHAARSAVHGLDVPLVYHGTLALRSERSWGALQEAVAVTDAPTFVDLNLRAPWWTPDRVRWCLRTATWMKLGDDELATVTGQPAEDWDAVIESARTLCGAHDVKAVIVTLGGQGSLLVGGGHVEVARAEPVPRAELMDTVGAGDGFCAVACTGLLAGWDAGTILRRANEFAADVCRIRGATTDDPAFYETHRERWRAERVT